MTSDAQNVDEYLKDIPEKRIEALTKIRQLCLDNLKGYEESMQYKMPSYSENGKVTVSFASQKQYMCLYILKHDVMLKNKDRLRGINHGKCCIRFSNPNKIDFELIKNLLQETVKSDDEPC